MVKDGALWLALPRRLLSQSVLQSPFLAFGFLVSGGGQDWLLEKPLAAIATSWSHEAPESHGHLAGPMKACESEPLSLPCLWPSALIACLTRAVDSMASVLSEGTMCLRVRRWR